MCTANATRPATNLKTASAANKAAILTAFNNFAPDFSTPDFTGEYSNYALAGAFITETRFNAAGELQWVGTAWGFVKCQCGSIRVYNGFNDDVTCLSCWAQLAIK